MSALTDRELLELAAKAIGFIPDGAAEDGTLFFGKGRWNPLTDDGDALRLAVKLDMLVDFSFDEGWIDIMHSGERIKEVYGDDPMAATRRAIVRAAAEIGRRDATLGS